MQRKDGLAYLTRCADGRGAHWSGGYRSDPEECPTCGGTNDAGRLRTPCSPYGRTAADCAPVAWRIAYLTAKNTHEPMSHDLLHWAMGAVVNDHPDVRHIVRTYGGGHYR